MGVELLARTGQEERLRCLDHADMQGRGAGGTMPEGPEGGATRAGNSDMV